MLAALLSLATLAAAAPPLGDVHVYGAVGESAPGLGAGFGLAVPVGPVRIEPGFEGGILMDQQIDAHLRAMVRLPLLDPARPIVPSLRLGPGVRWTPGLWSPVVMAGAAVDFRGAFGLRPRVGVDALWRWEGPISGRLTVGLVVGAARRQVAEPEPAPLEPVSIDDPTGRALVWVPHPVCQWVPAAEVDAWRTALPPEQPLRVKAPGYLPVEAVPEALAEVMLQPAPEHGSVVVVGWVGDRVRYAELEREAPDDGVVILQLPVGLTRVSVVGYGREAWLDVAVADGYASWLRAPEPGPMRVPFGAGSALLELSAREGVADIARRAGGGRFTVQGSHSSEGSDAVNDRLSRERAAAVAAMLIAQGVAPEDVLVLEPAEPDPSLTPREQRAVVIRPLFDASPTEGSP